MAQKTITEGVDYEVIVSYTDDGFGLNVESIEYVCGKTNYVVPIDNFLYDFLDVGAINEMEDLIRKG